MCMLINKIVNKKVFLLQFDAFRNDYKDLFYL